MTRFIRLIEQGLGLCAACRLLDDEAPQSAEFLWQLALRNMTFDAIHAIWTGPELSCPLPASVMPDSFPISDVPPENATSYPKAGDVVLAYIPAGTVEGLPPGPFFDLGIFYDNGGRLLMPFGWVEANVCAEIVEADFAQAQVSIRNIRNKGACKLRVELV